MGGTIWQESPVKLPFALRFCTCLIRYDGVHPKLLILGGADATREKTKVHLEYKIADLINPQTWNAFNNPPLSGVFIKVKAYLCVALFTDYNII